MRLVLSILLSGLAVLISAYLLPGVRVDSFGTAVIAAVVLALANGFVRPVLLFLTLPINILTLGLFTFVVNALIILLVSAIVPGFVVRGFFWAILFSLILSLINPILHSILD